MEQKSRIDEWVQRSHQQRRSRRWARRRGTMFVIDAMRGWGVPQHRLYEHS